LDRSETHHAQCVEVVTRMEAPLVTCEAVIAESCYLLRKLDGAVEAILKNIDRRIFLLPYRLSDNAARVATLVNTYSNVPMDFADACLVTMASEYGTGRILTLDHDFQIYRWGKNRPFDLLIDI
jgi:predicted nucleic acid-binding protein